MNTKRITLMAIGLCVLGVSIAGSAMADIEATYGYLMNNTDQVSNQPATPVKVEPITATLVFTGADDTGTATEQCYKTTLSAGSPFQIASGHGGCNCNIYSVEAFNGTASIGTWANPNAKGACNSPLLMPQNLAIIYDGTQNSYCLVNAGTSQCPTQ